MINKEEIKNENEKCEEAERIWEEKIRGEGKQRAKISKRRYRKKGRLYKYLCIHLFESAASGMYTKVCKGYT